MEQRVCATGFVSRYARKDDPCSRPSTSNRPASASAQEDPPPAQPPSPPTPRPCSCPNTVQLQMSCVKDRPSLPTTASDNTAKKDSEGLARARTHKYITAGYRGTEEHLTV